MLPLFSRLGQTDYLCSGRAVKIVTSKDFLELSVALISNSLYENEEMLKLLHAHTSIMKHMSYNRKMSF